MAWYRAELTVPVPIEEAFAYLASFDNVRHWDPSVTYAARIDDVAARPGPGSVFEVGLRFLGRPTTLRYTLLEHDAPHRILVRGANRVVTSTDTITLVPVGGGTRVTYDAHLRLHGPWRVLDVVLQRLFRPMAEAAVAGLQRELRALVVTAAPAAPTRRRPHVDPDHPSLGVIDLDAPSHDEPRVDDRDGVAA